MRKIFQLLASLIAVFLACYSATLRAEDVDVYVDNTANGAVPNLLFVMDTGANFSSSAAACTYASGGAAPTLSGTAGGIEQCALVNAIESLPNGTVNIGILVNNNNNFATDTRAATDDAYHETCGGTYGGCLVRKLTLMDAAGKASLVRFIKSWKTSGTNSATEFNVKSGGDRTANMMQEAWAYYNGKTGMSGKNYGTSLLATGCQKNFVIFIGNAFNTSGTPGDGGSDSPGAASGGALAAGQVGATDVQKAKISETVTFNPAACGVTTATASTSASNWSENWADEWARLMYQQDGGNSAQTGSIQNIITYSIGVVDDSSCKPDYPALLTTMAKYGGGKYFKTQNSSDLTAALAQILNEVQAVNSVFSSASLPVSVNAQGTYLNQIFLGMFRPDPNGNPRWMGNLKQYQLVKNSSGELVLGDANGNSAISSAGTGFISPSAVSLWTYKDTSVEPDAGGGFFRNDAKGTPGTTYDSADGEVVEKGGVAQQLRKENLTATFLGAGGTSANPRRLYTYCPSGTGCVAALTDSSNEFSLANSGISSAAFGTSTSIAVASITRSGATATVTTTGNHGLSGTTSVTIQNVTQPEYNGTKTVTVTGLKTFTFAVPDYPTTPAVGTYVAAVPGGGTTVTGLTIARTSSATGGLNSETATVTAANHGFTASDTISISGVTQAEYLFTGSPQNVQTNTFSFPVAITPRTPSQNSYTVAANTSSYTTYVGLTVNQSGTLVSGNTGTAHGWWPGMGIKVTGSTSSGYNGYFVLETASGSSFAFRAPANAANSAVVTVAVSDSPQPIAVGAITRAATTVSATATATTTATANFFGPTGTGTRKRTVNIAVATKTSNNEAAYERSQVEITCTNDACTTFTFPITVSPAITATTATTINAATVTANGTITSLSRNAAGTATAAVTMNAGSFVPGQTVNISASGTALNSESAYTGSWPITCTAPCTTFTFGPVPLSPVTTATGTNMQVYSDSSSPDRDGVIKWVRGLDSQGDENSPTPGGAIKVRESIHGDVLHSRPLVINYGNSHGIVAFYGANDGVFRAVNGNQTGSTNGVPPGGELWGLVLPDHYPNLYRQVSNAPELKFPSTIVATARPKDYFVDGPTGVYQKLNADNTINTAHIYLTMRRGGRFMYALDVSNPTTPTVLWKISNATSGFSELGQTWSRPRLTLLQNKTDPVLVFGAGYDTAQDAEPPGTDTMGRGIYVVNATTGALIWSASSSCGTSSATCKQVNDMIYSIPSDIGFVDRDSDGRTDKFYFGDMGGNIWRADINDADTANWTVTRVAALGCDTGACASGTTPRKFFFPPSVLTVKAAGATGSYDAVSLASGDREHPLRSTATGSSYNVADKFFMIKDEGTALGTPSTANVALTSLANATSTAWAGTGQGFYINFATGEKSVNAPLAVNGFIFFSTNRPIDRSITCAANLGEAKSYAVNPFDAASTSNTLAGGGMPPSAVSGLVNITTTNPDGSTSNSVQKFCIGCGISGSQLGGTNTGACNSALENCNIGKVIPKNLKRTYWYKK